MGNMYMFTTCVFFVILGAIVQGQERCSNPETTGVQQITAAFNLSRKADRPKGKMPKVDMKEYKKELSAGSAASRINIATWVSSVRLWNDMCPHKARYIKVPQYFYWSGLFCCTPKKFTKFRYPTVDCTHKRCDNVNQGSIVGNYRYFYYCIANNRRVYTIPVTCFTKNGWAVRRYNIYTYRCCSCQTIRCGLTKDRRRRKCHTVAREGKGAFIYENIIWEVLVDLS